MLYWEEIRKKGFPRYVLRHGFIDYGIIFVFVVFLIDLFETFVLSTSRIVPSVYLRIYLVGSLTYGIISWLFTEERYKNSQKNCTK